MKVLVIGSTGRVGKLLVEYSLELGHEVTAFARNIQALKIDHPSLKKVHGDVLYPALVESAVEGHDVVLSVIGIRQFSGPITLLSRGMDNIVAAMKAKGVKRLLTITGAGILQEDAQYLIMESLSFPPNLQNISLDHKRVFDSLKNSALDWTIVSPSFMHNGERTGEYLTKADYYPKKSQNQISVQDVADFITREMSENKFCARRVGIAHPV
ncbi:MAG: SDR family oxidoreductase [Bacteroidota bacterium]